MKYIIHFFALLSLVTSLSCTSPDRELVLLKVSEMGSAKISDSSLVVILEEELKRPIRLEYTLFEDTALKRLKSRDADFVIIPNNTKAGKDYSEVRTVTPLLPRILVVLSYNIPGSEKMNLKYLFEKHTILIEDMSHQDSLVFEKFFDSIGTHFPERSSHKVHSLNGNLWLDSSFVYVGLTHLHNPILRYLAEHGAKFHSIDKISNLGKGSSVEGLKLIIPQISPFIIPKTFYKGNPQEPVLTFKIPDVLVACEDQDKYLVYMVLKAITEKRSELLSEDEIYNLLDLNTKDYVLTFPLHEGAKAYKDRDKPSIWTRYASVLWPFLSILAILAGAFASLKRQVSQRKKIRIDLIYTELLQIRKRAILIDDDASANRLLKEMRDIREKAFDALMNNKLDANESFTIFLSLYSEVEHEINKLKDKIKFKK